MKRTDDLAQLKRLVMFYYVVELGSFAKAAEKLHMNRSGVSEQISMLEQYLNIRLLHRTTRKLSLTSDGEVLLPQAKLIAQTLDSIKNTLSEDLLHGRIRITTSNDFAIRWLNQRIKTFQSNYTGISFDLLVTDTPQAGIEEEIDLAFHDGLANNNNSVVAQPLLRERTQIYASKEYLSSLPRINQVEKLQYLHWILDKELKQNNRLILYKNNSEESAQLEPALFHRVNSPVVVIEQVKMGIGLGLILPSMVKDEIKEGLLIPVLPSWRGEEHTIAVSYSSHKQMPRRVKMFLDFLLK